MELSRGYGRITFITIVFAMVAIAGSVWATRMNSDIAVAASQYSPTLTSPITGAIQRGDPAQTWTVPDTTLVSHFIYESYYDNTLNNRIFSTNVYEYNRAVTGNQTINIWWRVIAVHKDGSRHASEPSHLIIDNIKPVVATPTSIQNPSSTTATITGSVIEQNLESVSLKLDGTDVDSSAVTLTGNDFTAELQNLSIGNHTVEIIATDKAGNKNAVKSHMFTVTDTIAPVITITSPTTFVEDEDVVITGTAADSHSTVGEVSVLVDGVEKGLTTATNGEFSLNLGKLAPGQYGVIATGTDEAGNRGASIPATITVTQKPAPEPEPTPPIDEPNTTPTDPQPQSPQTQPNPTRIVYLQPTTNTAQTTDNQDSEPVVETDDSKDQNALSARTQDIRGTTDSKDTTPNLLGMAWYYWLPIIAA